MKETRKFFPDMPIDNQNLPASEFGNESTQTGEISPLGLYVHIPFCRSKCNYCAFVSAAPREESEIDRYIDAVCHHLRLSQPIVGNRAFRTIYIGGGTPSLIGPPRLIQLFETIRNTFTILPDAEITVEANPESATLELFKELIPQGLNRVSMGAQSFQDQELRQLGRVHSSQETIRAVENARVAGVENISLDLIFALPHQTLDRWQNTLFQALACNPDHISTYGLSFEEGTLMERLREQGKVKPVLDETYIAMYDWTRCYLAETGWIQYEISNWSRPGKQSRHNQIYWRREDYLAVGVSAHGMVNPIRYSLIRDTGRYSQVLQIQEDSIQNNRVSEKMTNFSEFGFWHPNLIEERVELSWQEMASDVMIFGLRQTEGISISQFKNRFGYTPLERWNEAIGRLRERDWMEHTGDHLRLTKQAVPISNEVFVHFLD